MATTINEETTIELLDGTSFNVRPLKISLLREFMTVFSKIEDVADDNNKSMDLLMQCVQIALKQYNPELAEDVTKLEDVLDLPTVYKIVEGASGIDLGGSNLINSL
jgi:hypothetical protein